MINSADTVRQLRIDVADLKKKYINAVVGLDEAMKDMTVIDSTVPDGLIPLRNDAKLMKPSAPNHEHLTMNPNNICGRNYAEALRVSTPQNADTRM